MVEFDKLLEKMRTTHNRKGNDYTTAGDFENFERVSEVTGWFKSDIDKAFVGHITTKLSRLASLLGRKDPKNESVEDTLLDLNVYCGLWYSYHLRNLNNKNQTANQVAKQETEPGHMIDSISSPKHSLRRAIENGILQLGVHDLQNILSDVNYRRVNSAQPPGKG